MYVQQEKFINKYLRFATLVFPITLGAYPTIHYYGKNPILWKSLWIIAIAVGTLMAIVPFVYMSLNHFYVNESGIEIKKIGRNKRVNYDDVLKCFFKQDTEMLCLYMSDSELKIPLAAYPSSMDIAKSISRYIDVKII